MKITITKKIIPHLIIVVLVLVTCFFTVKPFLNNLIGNKTSETSTDLQNNINKSQLVNLMNSLFESKQLASLISIGKGLPILEKTSDNDNFSEINKNGVVGNIGRHNPFSATEN
ncbi:MAG: hypothetical protein WCX88_00290 [Patescibacteria group bacterium]